MTSLRSEKQESVPIPNLPPAQVFPHKVHPQTLTVPWKMGTHAGILISVELELEFRLT